MNISNVTGLLTSDPVNEKFVFLRAAPAGVRGVTNRTESAEDI